VSRPERALPVVSWGWLLVLVAGLGLAGAAGVVSHGEPADAGLSDVLPAALIGGLIALAIGTATALSIRNRPALQPLGAPTLLVIFVASGALIGISTAANEQPSSTTETQQVADDAVVIGAGQSSVGTASEAAPKDRSRQDITDLQGSIVLIAGLVLLAAATVFLMRRYELRAVEQRAVYLSSELVLEDVDAEPVPDDEALARALGRSLDELLGETDPRLAIQAAYGSLLNELSSIGLPRHRYEGPAEHLHRCLSARPLQAASITELVGLFQIARFSEHPVTDRDADRARHLLTVSIDALMAVPG
jgi:hypothetical protein